MGGMQTVRYWRDVHCPRSVAGCRLQVVTSFSFWLLGAVFFLLASNALAQEITLTTEHPKDYVSTVMPYAIEDVRERILSMFDSQERDFYEDYNGVIYDLPKERAINIRDLSPAQYKKFIAFPLVRPNKFYVFLGAYPHMQSALQGVTPLSVIGKKNPALERYSTLSPDARVWDVYLWSPDMPYWHSEYRIDGKSAPFHTYFIVHLAPVDTSHTTVEIIEDKPTIQAGRKFSVDEHGTVQKFDIRNVEPTTRDRELLLGCIHQFIERKVPGRHWFNCRDASEKYPGAQ